MKKHHLWVIVSSWGTYCWYQLWRSDICLSHAFSAKTVPFFIGICAAVRLEPKFLGFSVLGSPHIRPNLPHKTSIGSIFKSSHSSGDDYESLSRDICISKNPFGLTTL